ADLTPAVVVDAVRSPDSPGTTVPAVATSSTTTGVYAITPAAAGTWDLLFHAPTGYRFEGTGATTASAGPAFRLDPTDSVSRDIDLVQLATLDIAVVNADLDGAGDPQPFAGSAPTVTLHRVSTGLPGDPGDESIPVPLTQVGTTGEFVATIANLPVNWVSPTTVPAHYFVTITKDGYDTEIVAVTFDTDPPTEIAGTDIPVDLLAGQHTTVTLTLSRHGSISGEVHGNEPLESPPVVGGPLRNPAGTTMTATRVFFIDGTTAASGPVLSFTDNPASNAYLDPVTNEFRFSGPPGYYEIALANPWYEAVAASWPTGSVTHPDLYLMSNAASLGGDNVLDAAIVLDLLPTSITVHATGSGTDLTGALVALWRGGSAIDSTLTGPGGLATFADLAAGAYEVRVRLQSGGEDQRFPVFVGITTQYGATAAVRDVTVTTDLVALDGEITGTVKAVNSLNAPVPLPASFVVDREYKPLSPNTATEADLTGGAKPPSSYTFTPTSDATSMTIVMDDLPRGTHELLFGDVGGFTSPTPDPDFPITAVIGTGAAVLTDQTYTAADVTVEITLDYAALGTDPTDGDPVVVIKPTTQGTGNYTAVHTAGTDTYTFQIPPSTAAWTVAVTHPL
ncbi:MAG TPA: hypothetical protein PLV68_03240, partial [Ilumatobacteraceae bacterium]|nr:hypothetical protein [Ilumatobacteraceae bacterium]